MRAKLIATSMAWATFAAAPSIEPRGRFTPESGRDSASA
jgi:hypothetical protein